MMADLPAFFIESRSDKHPDTTPPAIHPSPNMIRNMPIYIFSLYFGISLVADADMNPRISPSNIRVGSMAVILR